MSNKGTILVVDDTSESLQLITEVLTADGYNVRPADSGELALTSAFFQQPELILLDIKMPGMDGFEVCKRLKNSNVTRDIPVIFLSAYSDVSERIAGLKLGAVDFMTKPFQREELLTRIEIHINLIKSQKQNIKTENEKRELIIKLNRAQKIARIGSFELDVESNKIWLSDEISTIFGIKADEAILEFDGMERFFFNADWSVFKKQCERTIETGAPFSMELKMVLSDKQVDYCQIHGEIIGGKNGQKISLIGTILDISKQKREEKEKISLQNRLFHSEKLAAIGALAAGIAHEINNPLTIIKGNNNIMQTKLNDKFGIVEKDLSVLLKNQDIALDRIATIVKDLRVFSRMDSDQIEIIDIHKKIQDILSLCEYIYANNNIFITCNLACEFPYIVASEGKFQQVILNVLNNSRDSIVEKGIEGRIQIDTYSQRGKNIIKISDNGCGIDEVNKEKIFDPFFTTKGVGRGTGLGLSISQSIISSIDGILSIESELNKGTVCTIELPRSEKNIERVETFVSQSFGKLNGKIVVVEDEERIRFILKEYLSSFGLDVYEACNGFEALKMIAETDFDIVLTDNLMPKLSGFQLVEELKKNLHVSAKIILMTGCIIEDFSAKQMKIINDYSVGILRKPFDYKDVYKIVAAGLH